MAANNLKASFYKKNPRITRVLVYALLEWILIVLLLLNGLFSYFISKFASFFALKPPCILCSRVDHLFEPDPPRKSYRRYLCDSHKVEVSQLGFCSLHMRLADAGDMCEDCGSSRPVPGGGGGAVLSWMRRSEMGEKDLKCSCCGIALESGFYSPYFLSKPNWGILDYPNKEDLGKDAFFEVEEGKIVGFDVLDRVCERERDMMKAILDGEKKGSNDNHGDAIAISELEELRGMLPPDLEKDKLTDKEFQDEITNKNANSEVEKKNNWVPNFEEEPLIKLSGTDSVPVKINDSSAMTARHLDQNAVESASMIVLELLDSITMIKECDLNQFCGEQEIGSDNGSTIHVADLLDVDVALEEEKNIVSISEEETAGLVEQRSPNAIEEEGIEEDNKDDLDISIGSEIGEPVLPTNNDLISLSVNQTSGPDQEIMVKEQLANSLLSHLAELSSAQLDESSKGCGPIDTVIMDSTIPILDHLLRIEDSDGNGHPEHNGNQSEDENFAESPIHITTEEDIHLMQRRLIFHKNEHGPESVDGLSLNSETDSAEPLSTDQLKSALESERNALRAIYLELEEERSASAIAANQTMAMINRLQEEKAAMQMEALQYQRMMEEQSEYDQEALQMLNELVVKREKEKEEVEKELESYKHKVMILEGNIGRARDRSLGKKNVSETSSSSSSDSLEYGVALENGNDEYAPVEGHLISLESSLDEFEDERKSILEQLKGLEEKLISLEEGSEEEKRSIDESQENENHFQDYEPIGDVLQMPENGSIKHNCQGKNSGFRGKRLLPLFDAVSLENGEETGEENGDDRTNGRERLSVQEEVNEVYERLQALEADREFIRHCVKSLKKGDVGLDLLNEILQHLRDLRRVELQERNSGEIASIFM